MDRISLVEWMIKHKVSTQITNSSIAIARALDSYDRDYLIKRNIKWNKNVST